LGADLPLLADLLAEVEGFVLRAWQKE